MRHLSVIFVMILLLAACKNEDSLSADSHFKKGEYEQAIELYTSHLKLKPRHIKSLYNRGRCYEELKQYNEAIKDFEKIIKIEPEHVQATLSLGKQKFRMGEYLDAVSYFHLVTENDESNALAYYLSARARHKMGELFEALDDYNNGLDCAAPRD